MDNMIRNIPSGTIQHGNVSIEKTTGEISEKNNPAIGDSVVLSQGKIQSIDKRDVIKSAMVPELNFKQVPGLNHIAVASLKETTSIGESESGKIKELMQSYMKAWPSVTSVITVGRESEKDSFAFVESRPGAIGSGALEGVFEVVKRLSGSSSIKENARSYPSEFHVVQSLNNEGTLHKIQLPGKQDAESISLSLLEGGKSNQLEQIRTLLDNLPKGKKKVVLLAGPSGAGKSSLISQLKEYMGDSSSKIQSIEGDMYFKEKDFPRTRKGERYWDNINSLDVSRLEADIASLIKNGYADTPRFNFITNVREKETKHVEMGFDDILVLDSIFAANKEIISYLNGLDIPHVTIYLDSEKAGDRLVRRIVRDYTREDMLPETIIDMWNDTIWPGEKEYVRPTILEMDPARDTFVVTKFQQDAGLSVEEINTRSALLSEYGLRPSYEAYSCKPEQLGELVRSEEKRLQNIIFSDTAPELEKSKAKRELERLRSAPRNQK